jgi:hypothetical protein
MAAEDQPITCEFCKKGRITWRVEEMSFRQLSNKGYVNCRVMVLIGTCDNCHQKSIGPEGENILNEAFKREYDKLP